MKNILVTQSSMPEYEEYIEEIKELWESHWLTNMGVKHKKLQEELIDYLDVNKIDLFTNGHMALELSLKAFDFPKGSEVITSPFTFASTTQAIVRNNLVPVFCDINPCDFTIDVNKIENLITEKTVAIMPIHVYGNICNIEKIESISKRNNLKVIYDAAHVFGVKYKEKGIGSYGDVSCFSFHATKVFNTIEGGCACFRNEEFGRRIYELKNFGIKNQEEVEFVGTNAKMNEFCAAMGLCNLKHVDGEIAKREKVVERYRNHLDGIKGIKINPIQKYVKPNYAYFPVIFDEKVFGHSRDEVMEELAKNNIGARKYFYPLTSEFQCYKGIYKTHNTPVAKYMSEHVLTLPLYAELELEDVYRICEIIKNMIKDKEKH